MKSVRRPGGRVLAWVVALEIVAAGAATYARRQLNEQELTARIGQESNPAKKVKLEIQLAELKLGEAVAAYDHDQFEAGPKLLQAYHGLMKQAWDLLEKSGRDAGRKPQGFKDLDIALRESARRLNDLKQRTPSADRVGIESIATETDLLHNHVLTALFPGSDMKEAVSPSPGNPPQPPGAALRPGDP